MRRGSNGGEMGWSALVALPDFGSGVLSASAVVAYVAVGAAAILGTSGCGRGVHVHFNNGQTKVHVGGSQDRTVGAQRDNAARGTGRHR